MPGDTANHVESLVAVKLSDPDPVLVTFTVIGAGFVVLPCVALKVRLVVESDSVGGGGTVTVNVTVMTAGDDSAPGAVTVICPVYVLAVNVPSVAEICNVCGAFPPLGNTDNHEESLVAVKLSVPAPVLVTFTFAGAGFAPLPWTALKLTLVVDTDKVGGAATTKVTVIVPGEPCAPDAVTVMCPV